MSEVTTIRLDILMQLRDDIADRTAEIEQRKADYNELRAALAELADLMQGVIDGDYKPDCFTLQPARRALETKP